MAISNKAVRLSAWAIFLIAWAVVIGAAVIITIIGISMAGGAIHFRDWLTDITPYALIWRTAVYVVVGTLYIKWWRPRIRAAQDQSQGESDAAHRRLIGIERLLLVVIVVIEVANLPDLIDWMMAG